MVICFTLDHQNIPGVKPGFFKGRGDVMNSQGDMVLQPMDKIQALLYFHRNPNFRSQFNQNLDFNSLWFSIGVHTNSSTPTLSAYVCVYYRVMLTINYIQLARISVYHYCYLWVLWFSFFMEFNGVAKTRFYVYLISSSFLLCINSNSNIKKWVTKYAFTFFV